jgi:hypothetical protein
MNPEAVHQEGGDEVTVHEVPKEEKILSDPPGRRFQKGIPLEIEGYVDQRHNGANRHERDGRPPFSVGLEYLVSKN